MRMGCVRVFLTFAHFGGSLSGFLGFCQELQKCAGPSPSRNARHVEC